MDTRKDAGPSGQSESTAGQTVVDAAEGYELQNVRGTQVQSAGSRAPNESVTGDTAINSAGPAQPDDGPRPDAADEGTNRPYTQSSTGDSKSSSKNVTGARANDGESMDQTARPGESNPAHQDDAAAQDNEAAAGSPRGPTGDSVIDIDGPQDSQSASASDHGKSMAASSRFSHSTLEGLQAYWYRLKRIVGDVDWEKNFNPSKGALGDENETLLVYNGSSAGWFPQGFARQFDKKSLAYLGFNVGLMTILHLGAMYNIDPEFFRGHIMTTGPVISSSESGMWCHSAFGEDGPFLSPALPRQSSTPNTTILSVYWSKRRAHPLPVFALMRNSNVVELADGRGQNVIQRMAWTSYKKVLGNAFESRGAATKFSTFALEAGSHRLRKTARNREMEQYLLRSKSPSEEIFLRGTPLGLATFLMKWLSGQVQDDVLPSPLHGDVAHTPRRLPMSTIASFDTLRDAMNFEIWKYTTGLIEQEAARLAEQAIVSPTLPTFWSLNRCRRLVNRLISLDLDQTEIEFALGGLLKKSDKIIQFFRFDGQNHAAMSADDFTKEIRRIETSLAALESRLKETFNLLVQAVTVIDSAENKRSASQSFALALLAALYLPATLTSGIFGMNLKIFTHDSNAIDWRPAFYTLLAVLGPSSIFIWILIVPPVKPPRRWGTRQTF